jgi:hypothetical protein
LLKERWIPKENTNFLKELILEVKYDLFATIILSKKTIRMVSIYQYGHTIEYG